MQICVITHDIRELKESLLLNPLVMLSRLNDHDNQLSQTGFLVESEFRLSQGHESRRIYSGLRLKKSNQKVNFLIALI